MQLAGKTAMITGGAGLIGSHIADLLLREDIAEIRILDNMARGRQENIAAAMQSGKVRLIEADIRDRVIVQRAVKGVHVLFHQAAIRITQCADEPRLALDVLVNGTYNVLEAAKESRVEKVIAASSASVYGLADEFPTAENENSYKNRTIYGASKAFNEALLRSFKDMYDLNYIALRYFNVYGPRMDSFGAYTEVMVRWMEKIETGKAPILFGSGDQTMDFVYVSDVARANIAAAKSGVTDEVFNVGRGEETSLKQLALLLMKVMGVEGELDFGPERKANPVPRRLADVSKARRMLGFEAHIGLEEGLALLVASWRKEMARHNAAKRMERVYA